jgi:type II secretory ATPase GspE/PulE/Tfp pilus assembly ATPase PilB-like protein
MFIADSLQGIISQRLVRKVCAVSRETYRPDAAACHMLGLSAEEAKQVELVRGIPSDSNFHTGYSGRTGVFEVMPIDSDVRKAILDGMPAGSLQALAVSKGMQTLEESARHKVLAGVTSTEEMHRVLTSFNG